MASEESPGTFKPISEDGEPEDPSDIQSERDRQNPSPTNSEASTSSMSRKPGPLRKIRKSFSAATGVRNFFSGDGIRDSPIAEGSDDGSNLDVDDQLGIGDPENVGEPNQTDMEAPMARLKGGEEGVATPEEPIEYCSAASM